MRKRADGRSPRPAAGLTYLECFGVGRPIGLVAGSESIRRLAILKIMPGGFDVALMVVRIEGAIR
jgi:hypothetical protein